MVFNFNKDYVSDNVYSGFYRGEVIRIVDEDNGLYVVKVYPFFADIKEDDIPVAVSNLTNSYENKSLKVGDWVWVFFERGMIELPVIFSLCNVKKTNLEFNKVEKKDSKCVSFDNARIEVDSKNLYLYEDDNLLININFKDREVDIKCKDFNIKFDGDFLVENSAGGKFVIDSEGMVIIKNNIESLYNIINKIYEKLINLMTTGMIMSNVGPCYYVRVDDLAELNILKGKLFNFLKE